MYKSFQLLLAFVFVFSPHLTSPLTSPLAHSSVFPRHFFAAGLDDLAGQIDAPRASMVAARADVVKREVITTQSEVCMLSKSL